MCSGVPLRRDIAAYRVVPPTDDEIALAELGDTGLSGDETDRKSLYGDT